MVRNLVLLGYCTIKSRSLERFGDPENILSLMALLCIVLMADGEAGEESRFWISVLPILAALVPYIDVCEDGMRLRRAFAPVLLYLTTLTWDASRIGNVRGSAR